MEIRALKSPAAHQSIEVQGKRDTCKKGSSYVVVEAALNTAGELRVRIDKGWVSALNRLGQPLWEAAEAGVSLPPVPEPPAEQEPPERWCKGCKAMFTAKKGESCPSGHPNFMYAKNAPAKRVGSSLADLEAKSQAAFSAGGGGAVGAKVPAAQPGSPQQQAPRTSSTNAYSSRPTAVPADVTDEEQKQRSIKEQGSIQLSANAQISEVDVAKEAAAQQVSHRTQAPIAQQIVRARGIPALVARRLTVTAIRRRLLSRSVFTIG